MFSNLRNIKKITLITVLMFTMLLVVSQVSAAYISCRSDPIVFLSNNTIIQFAATLETSKDDVISIRYEVHVPVGVSAKRIVYVPVSMRSKETVVMVADQAPGHYWIATVAQTGTASVPTTVTARLVAASNTNLVYARQTVYGVSGQTLTITF